MADFLRHKVEKDNYNVVITLFLDTNTVEFGDELGHYRIHEKDDLYMSAEKYIKESFPTVEDATVRIMVGTMVVGTLTFSTGNEQ